MIEQSVSGVESLLKQKLINTKYYITVLASNHYTSKGTAVCTLCLVILVSSRCTALVLMYLQYVTVQHVQTTNLIFASYVQRKLFKKR